MPKKLCDLKKLLKRDPERFCSLIREPTHVCLSCGRAANDRSRLCEPARLPDPDPELQPTGCWDELAEHLD
jgi:hypothetical protein